MKSPCRGEKAAGSVWYPLKRPQSKKLMLLAGADKEPGMRGEFVKGCDLGGHRPAQAQRGRLGGSRNCSVAPTLDKLGVSPSRKTPLATKSGIHAVCDSASGKRKGSSCASRTAVINRFSKIAFAISLSAPIDQFSPTRTIRLFSLRGVGPNPG